MLTFEDIKENCESRFDGEEAVATCVAGERIAYQLINVWDAIEIEKGT